MVYACTVKSNHDLVIIEFVAKYKLKSWTSLPGNSCDLSLYY